MTDQLADQEGERLRRPPAERFASPSNVFSLSEAVAELHSEESPARDGHRQVTVFHRGNVTHVLFAFEAGGALKEHSAHGVVTLHILEGRLRVDAAGTEHELVAGSMLVLDPDVPHDVRASERSAMLLTVHLERF